MRTRNHFCMILIVAALLLSACQPVLLLEETASDATEPTAAPLYAARGSFGVGYQLLVHGAESERPLEIHSWYPAQIPADAIEEVMYDVKLKDATWAPEAPPVSHGRALRDAAPDNAEGAYPLVVLSHGFTLSPIWYSNLAEHYASHGFIVLAPEHTEQFDPTFGDMWKTLIDRPQDVTQTLDYAEALTAPDGTLAGLIDMGHVAVVGHSYGGYTALAAAGARYDWATYTERCGQVPADDPLALFCMPVAPMGAEMANRAGLDAMPDGLWPSMGDPRVTAIIPMAGDSYLFDRAGLENITVPMMVMSGSADTGTPMDWGAQPAYDHAASEQKTLVALEGAEHMVFSTLCENQPWLSEHPYSVYFCTDPAWDKAQALDLIHHFSTAFLLDTLGGDAAAHEALLPGAAQFPGIEYTTTLE